MNQNLQFIPVNQIKISDFDLRNVNKESPQYQQLIGSLNQGYPILNPINVRKNEKPTPEDKAKGINFILIDGKHRLTAAIDCSMEQIPAQILDIPEHNLHFAQMIANMAKVETRPVQYAKQLQRILAMDEFRNLSKEEVLAKLGLNKSPVWFDNQLGLNDLLPEAQELVEEGKINVSSAYVLAKLPADEQTHWLERAQTNDPDFIQDVHKRRADLKKEAKGEKPIDDPLATAKTRKLTELKEEFERVENSLNTTGLTPDQKQFNLGYYEGIRFALRIDEKTLASKNAEKAKKEAERIIIAEKRKQQMAAFAEEAKKLTVTDEEIDKKIQEMALNS